MFGIFKATARLYGRDTMLSALISCPTKITLDAEAGYGAVENSKEL